ncbi:MAG: hypothetical protein A4E58_01609 [Syntrophorhabdus sp. PtaB.Bin006]|nr:MAG: hypothetical protein A4E58_01609 [Syntrophorhabdus sp. PtaB.Bin006]
MILCEAECELETRLTNTLFFYYNEVNDEAFNGIPTKAAPNSTAKRIKRKEVTVITGGKPAAVMRLIVDQAFLA